MHLRQEYTRTRTHTHRVMFRAYCFSTETMATGMCLNVTLYWRCLCCRVHCYFPLVRRLAVIVWKLILCEMCSTPHSGMSPSVQLPLASHSIISLFIWQYVIFVKEKIYIYEVHCPYSESVLNLCKKIMKLLNILGFNFNWISIPECFYVWGVKGSLNPFDSASMRLFFGVPNVNHSSL